MHQTLMRLSLLRCKAKLFFTVMSLKSIAFTRSWHPLNWMMLVKIVLTLVSTDGKRRTHASTTCVCCSVCCSVCWSAYSTCLPAAQRQQWPVVTTKYALDMVVCCKLCCIIGNGHRSSAFAVMNNNQSYLSNTGCQIFDEQCIIFLRKQL